jgi:hypothetical protein
MLKYLLHSGYHKEFGVEATSNKHMLPLKSLTDVSQPHPSENEPEVEEALIQLVESSYQIEPPIKRLKTAEVQEVISNLNPKKSSGYNLITGRIIKKPLLE